MLLKRIQTLGSLVEGEVRSGETTRKEGETRGKAWDILILFLFAFETCIKSSRQHSLHYKTLRSLKPRRVRPGRDRHILLLTGIDLIFPSTIFFKGERS
jgi:hypothetical protein